MTTLTLGPLAQIARTVRDIKESEAWYGATLGLPHLYTFGSLAFFDCGGTRLMLSAQEKPAHADGTEEWMAHFNDPEGRPLAIMSQVKP